MVGIPLFTGRSSLAGIRVVGRSSGCGRPGPGTGRAHRLHDELQLAGLHKDVMLAHAEEPTDADHVPDYFSALIDQDFTDVTDLFVLRIVDVKADHLR